MEIEISTEKCNEEIKTCLAANVTQTTEVVDKSLKINKTEHKAIKS
jgi:hypothetical protein